MYVTNKKIKNKKYIFLNRYQIMVKCLNIGKILVNRYIGRSLILFTHKRLMLKDYFNESNMQKNSHINKLLVLNQADESFTK